MIELNKDIKQRDTIIFGRYRDRKYQYGGVIHFEGLPVSSMAQLIREKFVDLNQTEGNSPTIDEMYNFAKKYKDYTFHGYVTAVDREDYGVYVEGIEKSYAPPTPEECQDLLRMFKNADELKIDGYVHVWYD